MRRWLLLGAAVVLVGIGAVAAFVLVREHQARNVRGSSTEEFVTTEAPPTPSPSPELRKVPWPMYGFGPERLRAVATKVRPPFRLAWTFHAGSLVEFPPAIAYGRLFFSTNAGVFYAVGAHNGKRGWKYAAHRCVAASPAVEGELVYATFLNRPPCNATRKKVDGRLIAFTVGFGRIRWQVRIGPSESSPLVAGGVVYVGDWSGRVWAFDADDGSIRWVRKLGAKIKAGVALSGNRLFVGDYAGHFWALGARTGRVIWRASSQQRLGGRGNFYSTPAVAYGRVYVGSTDHKMYSFGARSGKLRWSHGTGGYVYSSPAVWRRLVFAGSYDKHLYAFDAATGDVRWSFKANGPISGSPTVIDGIVYFATLKRRTYGLAARTGKQVWTFSDGKYTPAVTDGKRMYVVGYGLVYGLVPRPR